MLHVFACDLLEMSKVLLTSDEVNKISDCFADYRCPPGKNTSPDFQNAAWIKVAYCLSFFSFMFFNVEFQNSSAVSGFVGLSNDGGGLIL